nr:ribonuclease H-like domain-containing protein [Tanacetum cinerariifolium]
SEIAVLKSKLEKISKEKNDIQTKIKKFENASKSLDKLIGSQITDKSKTCLGYVSYNAFPPPHTGRFSPPRIDLSHIGLPQFVKPGVEIYEVKPIEVVTQTSSVKISEPIKENNDVSLIEDWESEGEDEVKSPPEIERKTVEPSVDKVEVDIPKQNDKPARRPVKYAEMYRTQRHRGMLHLGEELKVVADERHVLLKVPRKNNMYSVDMKNIVPKKDLTCLVSKAINDESMLWHRILGHINFKNINKLVKENLVRGLPSKRFENNQTCVACLKGKQHKVSFKSKI